MAAVAQGAASPYNVRRGDPLEPRAIVIGTRGSRLALAQAREVVSALRTAWPERAFGVVSIRTAGDALPSPPAPGSFAKGLFVKEIEAALLRGACDIAVHSLKDLPTEQPEGIEVAAVPLRLDPYDVLVSGAGEELHRLAPGARVGTSSPRRAALVLNARPDLCVVPLHGNVDTRLRKLRGGRCDALVLASAGLARLGLGGFPVQRLLPPAFIPAPGQGCLGLQVRYGDVEAKRIVGAIDHAPSHAAARAERAFLAALGGGCALPVGAFAEPPPGRGTLLLRGCILSPDGARASRGEAEGDAARPEELGRRLARELSGGEGKTPGA